MKPNRRQEDIRADIGHVQQVEGLAGIEIPVDLLYRDPHYIVISKPADVRMNGDFDNTVEKLLRRFDSSLNDVNFRWIHQLDYATSGALCVGLTREGASIACQSFANRETLKEYTAVVEGRLDPFLWPSGIYATHRNLVEDQSKGKQLKMATNDNKIRESSTWQHEAMRQSLLVCLEKLCTLCENDSCDISVLSELKNYAYEDFATQPKLRKRLRKFLKLSGINLEELPKSEQENFATFNAAGITSSLEISKSCLEVEVNDLYAWSTEQNLYDNDGNLDVGVVNLTSNSGSGHSLLVRLPLFEPKDNFRMKLGSSSHPGQFSETLINVLNYAEYHGRVVTKLLLIPRTGRRHQLRMHCAAIGHPIVGDWTYNPIEGKSFPPSSSSSFHDGHLGTSPREYRLAERMMLHAYKLQIPLPRDFTPSRRKMSSSLSVDAYYNREAARRQKHVDSDATFFLINVCAADPFILTEGKLFVTS